MPRAIVCPAYSQCAHYLDWRFTCGSVSVVLGSEIAWLASPWRLQLKTSPVTSVNPALIQMERVLLAFWTSSPPLGHGDGLTPATARISWLLLLCSLVLQGLFAVLIKQADGWLGNQPDDVGIVYVCDTAQFGMCKCWGRQAEGRLKRRTEARALLVFPHMPQIQWPSPV